MKFHVFFPVLCVFDALFSGLIVGT